MYISCWTLHPDCTLAFLLNSHPINQPYGGFLVHLKTRKRFPWPQKSPHEVLHFGRKYLKRKLCRFTNKPKPKTITFRRAVTMFSKPLFEVCVILGHPGWLESVGSQARLGFLWDAFGAPRAEVMSLILLVRQHQHGSPLSFLSPTLHPHRVFTPAQLFLKVIWRSCIFVFIYISLNVNLHKPVRDLPGCL